MSERGPAERALWGTVCASLRRRIGDRNFTAWIVPLRSTWTNGALALEAPDRLTRDRVARHFLSAIEEALAEAVGRRQPVRLEVAREKPPLEHVPVIPLPRNIPGPGHTFTSFVVGEANRGACAAARAVVEETKPAPLFLHGPSGVGKTHLLHAIFHALDGAGVDAVCLSAAQFVAALVAAYEARAEARFWAGLSPLVALLLDDAHSISGLQETQERLMDGLASWVDTGRVLVLTSDRPPADVPALLGRFRARFAGAVVAAIAPPEPRLRVAILEHKARVHGLALDARLASRLAAELGGNVRRLEGALTRLLAHARLSGRAIDEALALEVLPELRQPRAPLTIERIVELTAEAFAVSARGLRGRSRRHDLLLPRQVAMYLARKFLAQPFAELAAAFGRDHTTVMHAGRTVATRLERDPALAATLDRLERRLKEVAGR